MAQFICLDGVAVSVESICYFQRHPDNTLDIVEHVHNDEQIRHVVQYSSHNAMADACRQIMRWYTDHNIDLINVECMMVEPKHVSFVKKYDNNKFILSIRRTPIHFGFETKNERDDIFQCIVAKLPGFHLPELDGQGASE